MNLNLVHPNSLLVFPPESTRRVSGRITGEALQFSHMCRKFSHLARFPVSIVLVFVFGIGIRPSYSESGKRPYDLAACIRMAFATSPSIQVAEADLQIAENRLRQVHAARFPRLDFTWIFGPSPEARGDALTGVSNWQRMSVFTRTELSLVQPLFTFGKLAAAVEAASGGIGAHRAGLDGSRFDLEQQVARAYYLLLLANQLRSLANESRAEIETARRTIVQKLEADTGEFTYTDLHRIDRFVYDVEENANKVVKSLGLASSALRILMGLSSSDSLVLADGSLKPVDVQIRPLEHYLSLVEGRPDLGQIREGLRVRSAQVRAVRTDLFPQVFLAGRFKYGFAPNRDRQRNPFLKDEFNVTELGAVLGFRQSLSFASTSAKVKEARLAYEKLGYQARLATQGARLEIESAYRSLIEARANIGSARKARRATRRWFVSARDGFNAGLEEAGEMVDAVKEYGIIRAKYYQAVLEYNLAWVALTRATGNSILE